MEVGVFYLPSIGTKVEISAGMAGRRTDLYQRMLTNLGEQARYLDEHGYYGVAFTEHHFHIEGEEVSTNPIMLDMFIGMQTKRLRVGQLGLVLPCHNPLRIAEDVAILDQVTKGRAFAGFARGYQPRWVNTLGQHYGLADSQTNPEGYEKLKRDLYEENFEIIMKAWTNPTFSHHGKHWQIPPANLFWGAHEVTRKYGRGVDDKGILLEIGTVPETYQKPHPPMFQPFSFSEASVRWAAQHNVVPITIVCDKEICTGQFKACQDGAAQFGKKYSFGQGIGITREMVVADTDEEAIAIAREAGCFIWTKFFEPFGFNAAIARPGENYKDVPNTFEAMVDRGLTICGSPDTVSRKLERLFKDLPAEYFWAYIYNELVPQKAAMRTLELLTTKVLPRFTDKIR
ncbi:MAG TPA: LLM class flavin-dependent oxidoreductase [Candidatus Binataceae bacterium]|nr:LLM class flavin-dependent oxidoreductase [Candidatus Binataceae bacterium]